MRRALGQLPRLGEEGGGLVDPHRPRDAEGVQRKHFPAVVAADLDRRLAGQVQIAQHASQGLVQATEAGFLYRQRQFLPAAATQVTVGGRVPGASVAFHRVFKIRHAKTSEVFPGRPAESRTRSPLNRGIAARYGLGSRVVPGCLPGKRRRRGFSEAASVPPRSPAPRSPVGAARRVAAPDAGRSGCRPRLAGCAGASRRSACMLNRDRWRCPARTAAPGWPGSCCS